jgi:hypothetical protein
MDGTVGIYRHCEERSDEAIQSVNPPVDIWIASRSLSSGAHSRDPLARNDGVYRISRGRGPHAGAPDFTSL